MVWRYIHFNLHIPFMHTLKCKFNSFLFCFNFYSARLERRKRKDAVEKYSNIHDRIINYLNLPLRITAVLISAPTGKIGDSLHERVFITICFLWSLNLSGAFQVNCFFIIILDSYEWKIYIL